MIRDPNRESRCHPNHLVHLCILTGIDTHKGLDKWSAEEMVNNSLMILGTIDTIGP